MAEGTWISARHKSPFFKTRRKAHNLHIYWKSSAGISGDNERNREKERKRDEFPPLNWESASSTITLKSVTSSSWFTQLWYHTKDEIGGSDVPEGTKLFIKISKLENNAKMVCLYNLGK